MGQWHDRRANHLTKKVGRIVACNILNAILAAPNTKFINPQNRYHLIEADVDDNKFVDCAIQEDEKLSGYVMDLQTFDKVLLKAQKNGVITIEKNMITDIESATFEI